MINMNRDSDQKLEGKVPKGLALIVVIAITLSLTIIAGAILIVARGHYYATGSQIKHTKAFYLAEAGVQWALWALRTGNLPSPPPDTYTHSVATPEGNVDVTIDIAAHTGGLGVDWDIIATVHTEDIRLR